MTLTWSCPDSGQDQVFFWAPEENSRPNGLHEEKKSTRWEHTRENSKQQSHRQRSHGTTSQACQISKPRMNRIACKCSWESKQCLGWRRLQQLWRGYPLDPQSPRGYLDRPRFGTTLANCRTVSAKLFFGREIQFVPPLLFSGKSANFLKNELWKCICRQWIVVESQLETQNIVGQDACLSGVKLQFSKIIFRFPDTKCVFWTKNEKVPKNVKKANLFSADVLSSEICWYTSVFKKTCI